MSFDPSSVRWGPVASSGGTATAAAPGSASVATAASVATGNPALGVPSGALEDETGAVLLNEVGGPLVDQSGVFWGTAGTGLDQSSGSFANVPAMAGGHIAVGAFSKGSIL